MKKASESPEMLASYWITRTKVCSVTNKAVGLQRNGKNEKRVDKGSLISIMMGLLTYAFTSEESRRFSLTPFQMNQEYVIGR